MLPVCLPNVASFVTQCCQFFLDCPFLDCPFGEINNWFIEWHKYLNFKNSEFNNLHSKWHKYINSISGVMDIVLASNAVDCGFEPRSGQTEYYKFKYSLLLRVARSIKEKEQRLVGPESGLVF